VRPGDPCCLPHAGGQRRAAAVRRGAEQGGCPLGDRVGGAVPGAILVGQLMAVFMSNTGGAWDNAKKKIEDGFLGGKGSDAHKAGVIGDTVGDPLKDTAGPSIHVLIKLLSTVSLLAAPFFL
jgi:K(+)-stimulated pyrophosphate-energized sodium pump